MLFILMLFFVKSDSDDDKDEVLKQFDGVDIKIFFSAYSHYHLAVKTKGDRNDSPFIAINKYVDQNEYGVNDMAKLNVNGDGYEITIGKDMLCTSKNKNVVKCGSDDTDTVWKILPATFGYSIQKNKKCLTKSQTEALTLKKCTGDDDQKFDFKKFIGMDKCDEAKNQKDKDESQLQNADKNNINIKLVPPMFNYDDLFYYNHPPHMQMHQPDLYSNVYGFTDNEPYHHDDHLQDISHVHIAENHQHKPIYEPQKVLTVDTHVDPIIKTLHHVDQVQTVAETNNQPQQALDENITDVPKKEEKTNKIPPNYKLFNGLSAKAPKKPVVKEMKLFDSAKTSDTQKPAEKDMTLFKPK